LKIWIWIIILIVGFDCIVMTVEISIAVGFRIKESLEISDLSHYLLDNPLGTHFAIYSLDWSSHWIKYSYSNSSYYPVPIDSKIPWGVRKLAKKALTNSKSFTIFTIIISLVNSIVLIFDIHLKEKTNPSSYLLDFDLKYYDFKSKKWN